MNNNILIKCISNDNYTVIDLDSNILNSSYEYILQYLNQVICQKKNCIYENVNEYSYDKKKNKITAIVNFPNLNEYSKFSDDIQFIDCFCHEKNHFNNELIHLYNYINNNIENIKFYKLNELNKCIENNIIINRKFKKREDEQTEETENNSTTIYLILILVLVALIVGAIVFAVIHRIQDKKKEQYNKDDNKDDNNKKNKEISEQLKNDSKKEMTDNSLNETSKNESSIPEKDKQSNYSLMRNALDENEQINSKNEVPLNPSNDFYYKDYCQKSPILYNKKKSNIFDANTNIANNGNMFRMSNRPHSIAKKRKQNRISINPNCLPEIKIRPESLMLEEEFSKEVSKIFKYYDESLRYSKNIVQPFELNSSNRINKSQSKDLTSGSKKNSRNLQLNRLSVNIKRKKGMNALQKKISQSRSLVLLPLEPGLIPKRKSSLVEYRISFIQKGTYTQSRSEYYFDNSVGSPESEVALEESKMSQRNSTISAGSPITSALTSPTDGNISIDISNMNVKSKNRMSGNAVKTKSNIYQIQQMPYKIQYNEANKYDSINIMIENTAESISYEDSVVIQVSENDDENDNKELTLNNTENENTKNDEKSKANDDNIDLNTKKENKKLKIIIDTNNNKGKLKNKSSKSESVSYDIHESEENEKEKHGNTKCLMSPVCEWDNKNNDEIEMQNNLHDKHCKERKSGKFSVNLECKKDDENYDNNSNNKSYCEHTTNNKYDEKYSNKRNTFGFLDLNSEDALKSLNDNINKNMILSNQRESRDING